jgi:hypothetical protein
MNNTKSIRFTSYKLDIRKGIIYRFEFQWENIIQWFNIFVYIKCDVTAK